MIVHGRALGLVTAALVIGVAVGMIVAPDAPRVLAADGDGEKIVYLRELEPMRRHPDLHLTPEERSVIGGKIWNAPVILHRYSSGPSEALWDTGGTYDLFEGYFGVDDDGTPGTATVVFIGDGERLGSLTVKHGDEARFFSCPMNRCRAFTVRVTDNATTALMLLNARLVRGRTTPSQPQDIVIDDGEIRYIERPGEYKFRFRRAE